MVRKRMRLGVLLTQAALGVGILTGLAFGACPAAYDTCAQQGISTGSCTGSHTTYPCSDITENGVQKCCCYTFVHY